MFKNVKNSTSSLCMGFTLIFVLLLSIQLTGLTCLQDFQTLISTGDRLASSEVVSETVADGPIKGAALPPSQKALSHDCPCHYMVTYLCAFALTSTPFTGTLAIPRGQTVDDHLPQSIFRPPLSLL